MIIINPGTEDQEGATEQNALKSLQYFLDDLGVVGLETTRNESADRRGWFGFKITYRGNEVEVDIPGSDPEVVRKGEPWASPRLYVNSSSWLWGFALGITRDALGGEE
jgi:hypothetical protein